MRSCVYLGVSSLPEQTNASDGDLFARSVSDPDAFSEVFERHAAAVQRWLLRRTRDRDVSLDMTAETFARAWEKRRAFRVDEPSARPWLLSIAQSVLVDSIRRHEVEKRALTRLGMERVWARSVDVSDQWIDDALAALPTPQRSAVWLRYVSGLSFAQIARHEGCTRAAAKMRVQRGLQQIRSTMGSE